MLILVIGQLSWLLTSSRSLMANTLAIKDFLGGHGRQVTVKPCVKNGLHMQSNVHQLFDGFMDNHRVKASRSPTQRCFIRLIWT
ncbi:hypothetical protein V1523DRAFT_435782 [Lipomyces doorenjongii]